MRPDFHYGVSVGIDWYPGIRDLKAARGDAMEFANWLESAGVTGNRLEKVILPDDAKPPTTRRDAEPRAGRIWEAVFDKIEQARAIVKANPRDWYDTRLYFFFSGHGIAPNALDATALAADSSAEWFGNSASLSAMTRYLMESGDFAEVVVVADCCRLVPIVGSAPFGAPTWTPRAGSRPEDVKVAALYATRYRTAAREPSDSDPNNQRGYFTKAILDGLHGAPRAIQDGKITTVSLNSYARQRVIDDTKGKQKPPVDVGSDILLATNVAPVPPSGRQVRIKFPSTFRGDVELRAGNLERFDGHSADGADWVLSLKPGLYQVVPIQGAEVQPFGNNGYVRVDDGKEELVVQL